MAGRENQKLLKKIERERLERCAKECAGLIARRLLPYGRVRNHHWISSDPQRPHDGSANLSVDLVNGSWRNFYDGSGGPDIISFLIYVAGIEPEEAEAALKKMLEPLLTVSENEN